MTAKKVTSTKKKKDYGADSIVWIDDPMEQVRTHPTMYVGGTDQSAVRHLALEILDNANDEANEGHGDIIKFSVSKDGAITIEDNARGIPVGPHPKNPKLSAAEVAFTQLHAGAKSSAGSSYATSRGVHGIGSAAVNALSERLTLEIKRDGKIHRAQFKAGKIVSRLKVVGKCHKTETGTKVSFVPDTSIMKYKTVNWQPIVDWLDINAYLNNRVTYYIDIPTLKLKTKIRHKGGLADWLSENTKDKTVIGKPLVVGAGPISFALQWTEIAEERLVSFVSSGKTPEGGTHVKGLEKAISEVLGKFTTQRGALKKTYRPEDLRAGLVGVLNIKLNSPKFSSQTKEKLVSPEGETIVYQEAVKELTAYFNKHKATARAIIERANRLRAAHENFKMSAKAAAALKPKRGQSNLPAKLAVSDAKDRSKVTLYLVEGDSAAGSLIQARDATKDEVLALKGKPPNIMKGKQAAALENEEIINILRSIGYDPSNKDDHLAKMRVGKVGILSDSDDDGFHVTNLVIALLWTITPQLITEGKVFVVSDALFMAKSATKTVFASSVEEAYTKIGTKKATITRVKGWGEANPADLAIHVFDDATKQHINVTGEKANEIIKVMGEDISYRREILGV